MDNEHGLHDGPVFTIDYSVDADWMVKYRRERLPVVKFLQCSIFLGFVVTRNLHHSCIMNTVTFRVPWLHNILSANRFNFALLQIITLAYNCNRSVCPERNAKNCGLATIWNPEHL